MLAKYLPIDNSVVSYILPRMRVRSHSLVTTNYNIIKKGLSVGLKPQF